MKYKNIDNTENVEKQTESSKDFTTTTVETNLETSFFYTNDKAINQIDDIEIFQFIQIKYPELNLENDDPIIKKQIAQFLDNEDFIQLILNRFNLSIFELFGVLYKKFSSIFKGPYIKKIRNIITGKKYIHNDRKKHDY